MRDNQEVKNGNEELLTWAVENIAEWNDEYTHLRSDASDCPVFYTNGHDWDHSDGYWGTNDYMWYNIPSDLGKTTPQVISKQEWVIAKAQHQHTKLRIACDTNLGLCREVSCPTSSEPLQEISVAKTGHIHAELLAEYAEVARTNPEPWKEFEVYNNGIPAWVECDKRRMFEEFQQYRRKPSPPKTMNIGGIVVEACPLKEAPKYKEEFFYVHLQDKFVVEDLLWSSFNCGFSSQLGLGRSFATQQEAQAVADALNSIYKKAVDEAWNSL